MSIFKPYSKEELQNKQDELCFVCEKYKSKESIERLRYFFGFLSCEEKHEIERLVCSSCVLDALISYKIKLNRIKFKDKMKVKEKKYRGL